jgi:hypothetical protein
MNISTMYKLVSYAGRLCSVNKLIDGVLDISIPFDPANTDYQAYLRWLEEGNEPLPADEPQ